MKCIAVLGSFLMSYGFVFADFIGTVDVRVRIEFGECYKCEERPLYLPDFDVVEVPSEKEAFVRIIRIEADINELGEVTSTRPGDPESYLGNLIATRMLDAQFRPIAKNGVWIATKEVLYFSVLPIIDGQAYQFINEKAVSLPIPEIQSGEPKRCSIQFVRVLVGFEETGRRALSVRAISGDASLAPYAESAAMKEDLQSLMMNDRDTYIRGGILEYKIPGSGSCSKIVSSCNISGKLVILVMPKYSSAARFANASGLVHVDIVIDEEGRVIEASTLSGHPLLRNAAIRAALQSSFHPSTISGKPVRVRGVIVYNFK